MFSGPRSVVVASLVALSEHYAETHTRLTYLLIFLARKQLRMRSDVHDVSVLISIDLIYRPLSLCGNERQPMFLTPPSLSCRTLLFAFFSLVATCCCVHMIWCWMVLPLSATRIRELAGCYRSSVFPREHQPAVQQLGEGPGKQAAPCALHTVFVMMVWR